MSDQIKFHLDGNVNPAVAEGLRRRGVDVTTSQELDMLGASDIEHLTKALDNKRVIFTQDDDFLKLHASGARHAGIVYAKQQTPVGYIIRGLMLIHQVLNVSDMANHIEFL